MTIRNFYSYSVEKLSELHDSLELCMDIDTLRLCKEHCAKFGKMNISVSELRILDEIFKSTPLDAANAAVNELLCGNTEIISTFNDLLSKSHYVSENKHALSLSSLASVSNNYMNVIGLKTPPMPKELIDDLENKAPSLIGDIIETAKLYDKNPIVNVIINRLHNEQFEIDDEAFSNYFLTSVNKVINATLSFIAYGYDRQLISLYLKYNFPKNADSKVLGDCLATILGAYRVTCELCMTDCSVINYTDSEEISLTVTPFVKAEKAYMSSKLISNQAKLYLLSFNRLDNGMPDFESFRKMCDLYHALSSRGKIKSAVAINGNLREAVSKMEGAFRIIPTAKASEMLDESFCGILLECYLHPKGAIALGTVEPIPQPPVENSDEIDAINDDTSEMATEQIEPNLPLYMSDNAVKSTEEAEILEQIGENTQKSSEENSEIC